MTMTCVGFAFFYAQLTCTVPTPPVADTFCTRYAPIYWSSADTRATKEAVDLMNRRWKRSCKKLS